MATLTRTEIERALRILGEVAATRGAHVELFLVGGAVMVLRFDARPSTKDVDVVILSPEPISLVREMAARVAADLDWPDDWLNDGAKGFVVGAAARDVVFQSPGITVFVASVAQMLAMKVSAWRDDVDMGDAEILLRATAGGREEVWTDLVGFVPHGLRQKARYAFEELWDAVHDTPT